MISIFEPDRKETDVEVAIKIGTKKIQVRIRHGNRSQTKIGAISTLKQSDGNLTLFKSSSESVRDVKYGRPLLLNLEFPVQDPLPKVSEIHVGGNFLCATSDSESKKDIGISFV